MDDLILLMLFAYPGALVKVILGKLAERHWKKVHDDATTQAAKYLFFSAAVNAVSLLAFGWILGMPAGLTEWIKTLKKGWNIGIYLALSLIVSILFSGTWYLFVRHVLSRAANTIKRIAGAPVDSQFCDVWSDTVMNPAVMDTSCVVAVVKRGGKIEECGFLWAIPKSITENPSLSLSRTDLVRGILADDANKGKADRTIGGVIAAYVSLDKGFEIEFRDASKLYDSIMNGVSPTYSPARGELAAED